MRWLHGAAMLCCAALCCAGPLWAQSLGDVARAVRDDTDHPKAKRVFTNADLNAPPAADPVVEPAKDKVPAGTQAAKSTARSAAPAAAPKPAAARPTAPKSPESAAQRRIAELNERAQLLAGEVIDLQNRITSLNLSNKYGDPNRLQKNQDMQQLTGELEAKRSQLAALRAELAEENDRARSSSVLK